MERLQAGLNIAVETTQQALEVETAATAEASLNRAYRPVTTGLAEQALCDPRTLVLDAAHARERACSAAAAGVGAAGAGDATGATTAAAARAARWAGATLSLATSSDLFCDVGGEAEGATILIDDLLTGSVIAIEAHASVLVTALSDGGAACCGLTVRPCSRTGVAGAYLTLGVRHAAAATDASRPTDPCNARTAATATPPRARAPDTRAACNARATFGWNSEIDRRSSARQSQHDGAARQTEPQNVRAHWASSCRESGGEFISQIGRASRCCGPAVGQLARNSQARFDAKTSDETPLVWHMRWLK